MNTNRYAREPIPLKAVDPFSTRFLSIIIQFVQYLLRLFFGDRVIFTAT
jgi:hypothetical protein